MHILHATLMDIWELGLFSMPSCMPSPNTFHHVHCLANFPHRMNLFVISPECFVKSHHLDCAVQLWTEAQILHSQMLLLQKILICVAERKVLNKNHESMHT